MKLKKNYIVKKHSVKQICNERINKIRNKE